LFNFVALDLPIDGARKFTMSRFEDHRGCLSTIWDSRLSQHQFVLDKFSSSNTGVFRGLHGDHKSTKHISVLSGKIFFVIVDPRLICDDGRLSCWFETIDATQQTVAFEVGPGLLNGFYVYDGPAIFFYKWAFDGNYVDADAQTTIFWNDPRLSHVPWPFTAPILSSRDASDSATSRFTK
jgi:dTDP-4-dehydrorhamnose 3,5-epimerase